jgi:release factor glutamine methyltransferase
MRAEEWIRRAVAALEATGVESPVVEARALLASVLNTSETTLLAHPELPAPPEADALLRRRLEGEPLAYVLGRKEFAGREFLVTRDVLIPRPETEILLEESILEAPPGSICLDLGTGSGCLGISAALERRDTLWVLSDISLSALRVARENARRLGASVSIVQADALSAFRDRSFGVIACNPPYVAPDDARLEEVVRRWEPPVALFAEDDGLAFIRRVGMDAPRVLIPGGSLVIEVGLGQAAAVSAMLEDRFDVRTRHDYAGVQRVVIAVLR